MNRVLVSTGAVVGKANGRDFRKLRDIAPRLDCDGFELMFYSDWYGCAAELVSFIRSLPYPFPTFHCDKHIGELLAEERTSEALGLFEINCRTARDIGAELLILHLWNGIISDSNIAANFEAYPALAEIADRYGLTLTAENVLAHYGTPLSLLLRLLESFPGAMFTYDTKMADFDNENAVAFDKTHLPLWKNVRHLHINDRAGAYRDWKSIKALHIGAGQVDFDGFFRELARTGYRGDFTVEASSVEPDGRVRCDLMNESVRKLRKYIDGMRR